MNKYTKAMPAVRRSALYKSLRKSVRKADHDALLRQLVWAFVDYKGSLLYRDFNQSHLLSAFLWAHTPQGHAFWDALNDAIKKARS